MSRWRARILRRHAARAASHITRIPLGASPRPRRRGKQKAGTPGFHVFFALEEARDYKGCFSPFPVEERGSPVSSKAMLLRPDHVNIRTAELERARSFYVEVLGFRVGPRPAFSFGGAWLYCGDFPVVHLVEVAEAPSPTGELRLEHFALRAQGLADFLARLKAHDSKRLALRIPFATFGVKPGPSTSSIRTAITSTSTSTWPRATKLGAA